MGLDDNAFANWDASRDGMLRSAEPAEGAFGIWDRNDDNLLDPNEFGMGIDWLG